MLPPMPPALLQPAQAPAQAQAAPRLLGPGAPLLAKAPRIAVVGFRVAFTVEQEIKASTKQSFKRGNGDGYSNVTFHNILVASTKVGPESLQALTEQLHTLLLERLRASGREVRDLGPMAPAEAGQEEARARSLPYTFKVLSPAPFTRGWEPEDPLFAAPLPEGPDDAAKRVLAGPVARVDREDCALVSVTLAFRFVKGKVKQKSWTWLDNQPNNEISATPELALLAERTSVLVVPVSEGRSGEPLRAAPAADAAWPRPVHRNPEKVAEWSGRPQKAKGAARTLIFGGLDNLPGEETKRRGVGLEVDPAELSEACLKLAGPFFDAAFAKPGP